MCSLESEARITGFQPRDARVNSLSNTMSRIGIFTVPLAVRALRSCWRGFRSRSATCVRKRSESDLSATFEDLKIQNTGDVVKHFLHTTSLAAELLRGPGGKLRDPAGPSSPSLSSEICQVLSEAQSVCKAFLPQVLRGHASVSKLLDLFVEAFDVAGQPSHASTFKAFKALEAPLVIFHTKAPLAMRKALQLRIVGADARFTLIQLELSTFLVSI